MKSRIVLMLSGFAITVAAGCGGDQTKAEAEPPPVTEPVTEEEAPPQASLQVRVRQALENAAGIDPSQIHIRIEEGGRVFLSGTVRSQAQVQRVEQAAASVEGVKTVNVIDLKVKD